MFKNKYLKYKNKYLSLKAGYISHKKKYIFIHIPKTGGNSLTKFLKKDISNKYYFDNDSILIYSEFDSKKEIKHRTINYYNNRYDLDKYFKFCIVRNPYDRIMSHYFYDFKYTKKKKFEKNDFIKFVKSHKMTQFNYVSIDGEIKMDKIVRFENMINDFKDIDIFKNIDFSRFPHINKSKNNKNKYQKFYDNELQDLVYNTYLKDFEEFNYKYEI